MSLRGNRASPLFGGSCHVFCVYVLGLHGLVFLGGSGGGHTEVVSVRSCWKLPPCPAETIPDGSKDRRAAGPARDGGNTSVITFKKKSKQRLGCSFNPSQRRAE